MKDKPKISMYWASSCGGCEVSLVNLHEKLLEVDRNFDLVFCPCLMDTKYRDIEALDDGAIAITFFNGAIRSSENAEMARLLRRKSQVLIAFGSCAFLGGIPSLSNLSTLADHLRTNYLESPTVVNSEGALPRNASTVQEGELELPVLFDTVKNLGQTVKVDYYMPGCPPESHRIWNVLGGLIEGKPLPPPGAVLGAGDSTVCRECNRQKTSKSITEFKRAYEFVPNPERCLLEQGLLCLGIGTRDGCGALCPQVNMPCSGCYGPPEGVSDSGANMLSALGSVLDVGAYKGLTEAQVSERADEIFGGIPDPAGTFYQYSLAGSLLRKKRS
jgi:F420-non-reducing hydrogenase small subunit